MFIDSLNQCFLAILNWKIAVQLFDGNSYCCCLILATLLTFCGLPTWNRQTHFNFCCTCIFVYKFVASNIKPKLNQTQQETAFNYILYKLYTHWLLLIIEQIALIFQIPTPQKTLLTRLITKKLYWNSSEFVRISSNLYLKIFNIHWNINYKRFIRKVCKNFQKFIKNP